MRYDEINIPSTHPHLVTVRIDPAHLPRLRRYADNDDDVARIIHVDRNTADLWPVTVACASRTVRDVVEEAWD